MSEQETCRTFVVPGLRASGWDKRQIREQYRITNGKIIASARRHRPGNPLVADYVLEYRDDLPLAVVEAKRTRIEAAAGIEQAKRYAQQLELPVAYATNGHEIWEIEIGGAIRQRSDLPSPDELWERFCESQGVESRLEKEMMLAAFDSSLRDYNLERKRPRYYQRIAVNRALRAIARGQRRILPTLATGTGKTMVTLQLVAKLRKSGWTAVYFALYQSLEQGDEQALFSQYSKDYFDLIIVDECHRGSAGSSSQWRGILEHFDEAVQIGLTATPVRKDDADTYGYFGNPVYEYSLRDGIEDGFLAPYRVRRVRLNIDMTGFRPSPGQRDVAGDVIPDRLYTPRQYEKVLAVLDRTQEGASTSTEWRCTSGTTCTTSWSPTARRCGSWSTASSCATGCCR